MPEEDEQQPAPGEQYATPSRAEVPPPVEAAPEAGDGSTASPFDILLEDAPPRVRQILSEQFSVAGMISGPLANPLLAKLDGAHIHKMLDYSEAESQREDKQLHADRKFGLFFFGLVTIAVLSILAFLVWQDENDLALEVLKALGYLGGGFGGGFGYAKLKSQ